MAAASEILKYMPFSSSVDVGFWFELAKKKLDVLKLDERELPISGFYGLATNAEPPARFNLEPSSFLDNFTIPQNHFGTAGRLLNKNTIESYKNADKASIAAQLCDEIWDRIEKGHLTELNPYVLLTFADLKKYVFNYWFCFPALVHPSETFQVLKRSSLTSVFSEQQLKLVVQSATNFFASHEPSFLLKYTSDRTIETKALGEFDKFYEASNTLVVVAAQGGADSVNWTVRNLLLALKVGKKLNRVRVCQYKCDRFNYQNIDSSEILEVDLLASEWKRSDLQAVGWERNTKGKLSGRLINLSSAMDQTKLAANAVDLNLKLMRWRLLPNLQLEKISQTKCLLFGAGTLGCNVARNLMAWGVRHITFVDNGKVSFSNPVRQWLYTFEDSKQALPKAATAAERVKDIFPDIVSRGVELTIPMPGHLVSTDEDRRLAAESIATIEALVDEHDVAFLLLDSREARWLPTLISEAKGKPVITTALGFDNFVVMRHGLHHNHDGSPIRSSPIPAATMVSASPENIDLGCYFCNDVVAPQDSAKDRTLDQQCTVTRPGLSSMASSSAVELLVTLLHHPQLYLAPGDPKTDIGSDTPTELGIVPHQIRGYLSFFNNLIITGHRYDKCVACSDPVVEAYISRKNDFLFEAFNNPKHLEDITGITAMKQEESDTMNDWDTESDFDLGEKNGLDDF
jgi:ubiquitin-like modifier-activating enzyme ATG7